MKREIFLKATAEKKQLPKQWGGMQYEDNATEIVFDITDIAKENILWRIDFDSATAGYDPSETLIAEGRNSGLCVARFIPYTMTRHGGEIQVTLVGTEIDEQGEAVAIAYTVPFFAFFTDVEQHEESEDKAAINISAAEKSALDSAQRAEDSAEEAQQSAEAAEIAQQKTEESIMALEAGSTIIFQGGNASSRFTVDIAVDDELSEVSDNVVKNKVVAKQIANHQHTYEELYKDLNNTKALFAQLIEKAKLDAHPIGSIYISENNTSPAELFGGTWEQIKDAFIWATGDTESITYTKNGETVTEYLVAGSTGGEAEHTLTLEEIPAHDHTLNGGRSVTSVNVKGWALTDDNLTTAYETQAAGGGKPHNNMPPYLAAYMWKRIA